MKFLGRDREEYNLSCDYMSKNNASIELGSRFRLLRSNSSIAIYKQFAAAAMLVYLEEVVGPAVRPQQGIPRRRKAHTFIHCIMLIDSVSTLKT
jgi:hypothetical protein